MRFKKNLFLKRNTVKKLTFFFIPGLFIFVVTTFTACSLLGKEDKCDATVKPEIEVGIKATIHILDKNKNPIPNQLVELSFYKTPCNEPVKGKFTFKEPTNSLGIIESSVAYYKLRNLEDKVWVDAYAVKLSNPIAETDSQLLNYKYSDFSAGLTKEVHVYIYRNF